MIKEKTIHDFARAKKRSFYFLPRSRLAAMEMSVGTIVTVVLLMTVLIMGLVVVRTIFSTTTENINAIDQAVKDQINKLFTDEGDNQVVVLPESRTISLKKGESGGFAFSVKNGEGDRRTYSYEVKVGELGRGCTMTPAESQNLILVGGKGQFTLESGSRLETPILVKYQIPETAKICTIRYNLDIQGFNTITVDLEID